jgi:protein transport protein SEC24
MTEGFSLFFFFENSAIDRGLQSSLSDAREALVNKCIDILSAYRTDVFAGSSAQLVLPESLKAFPLYVLAIAKNIILRAGSDIKSDERTYWIMNARIWPVHTLIHFIYPRLFPIFPLSAEVGVPNAEGRVVLPPIINLTSEKLDRRSAYLLDDSQHLILWIGRQIQPDFVSSLFAVPSLEGIDTSQVREFHLFVVVVVVADNKWGCAVAIKTRRKRNINPSEQYFERSESAKDDVPKLADYPRRRTA